MSIRHVEGGAQDRLVAVGHAHGALVAGAVTSPVAPWRGGHPASSRLANSTRVSSPSGVTTSHLVGLSRPPSVQLHGTRLALRGEPTPVKRPTHEKRISLNLVEGGAAPAAIRSRLVRRLYRALEHDQIVGRCLCLLSLWNSAKVMRVIWLVSGSCCTALQRGVGERHAIDVPGPGRDLAGQVRDGPTVRDRHQDLRGEFLPRRLARRDGAIRFRRFDGISCSSQELRQVSVPNATWMRRASASRRRSVRPMPSGRCSEGPRRCCRLRQTAPRFSAWARRCRRFQRSCTDCSRSSSG